MKGKEHSTRKKVENVCKIRNSIGHMYDMSHIKKEHFQFLMDFLQEVEKRPNDYYVAGDAIVDKDGGSKLILAEDGYLFQE